MKTFFYFIIIAFIANTSSAQCPVTSDFNLTPSLGCAIPHTVFFTDQSTNPDTWSWDFGDGGTSTVQNPVHNYVTAGTFTVELTISDTIFGCSSTSFQTVTIEIPNADFTGTPLFGCGPLTTTFTDASTGSDSWSWDFGDGGTSSVQNPTHLYVSPGVYTVSLTITSLNGCTDTRIRTNYVQVIGPDVNFGGDVLEGCNSFTTQFTDSTIFGAPIISWQWDFGDGGTSNLQNPSHDYTMAGAYDVSLTVTDIDGCSRTFTQTQYVNFFQSYNENVAATVCTGGDFTFPDGSVQNNITAPLVQTSNLTTVNGGCDSVVVTTLSILSLSTGIDTRTECDALTWLDGITYNTSNNTATHILIGAGANGCDSTVTLDLTIINAATGTDVRTECGSLIWLDGVTYTASNNSATHTLVGAAANGCDSIVTLDLTIINSATSTDVRTECNTLVWIDGMTYTSSNNTATYTIAGGAANGCDSIISLDLTINTASSSTTNEIACDDFVWNGVTYTSTGVYDYVTTNAVGCDSVASLNLTVNYSNSSTTTHTECVSYLWNGTTYTISGIYTYTSTNSVGCDSIATLDLTINVPTTSTTTVIQCTPYLWNGTTYSSSGIYTFISLNAVGCDSIQTLDLSILAPPVPPIIMASGNTTFCDGDSLELVSSQSSGNTWSTMETAASIFVSSTGSYYTVYEDANGCTSTSDTMIVTVNALPVVTVGPYDDLCNTASFFTITGGSPAGGTYAGPGIIGGIFSPSAAGVGTHTITYEFTYEDGCINTSSTTITIEDCIGIKEISDIDLTIYPNPVSDVLTLKTNGVIIDAVSIYDEAGRLVQRISSNSAIIQFNTVNMSSGMYTIEVKANGNTYRSKVFKS